MFWSIVGNLQGVNRSPTAWGDVFCVKTLCVLTWGDEIITHRLSWPVFQPLQVKHTEEPGGNRAWKKQWRLCLREAAPLEGSVFCVFQRSQLPSQTMQQKDFQRLRKIMQRKKKEKRAPNQCNSPWHFYTLTLGDVCSIFFALRLSRCLLTVLSDYAALTLVSKKQLHWLPISRFTA